VLSGPVPRPVGYVQPDRAAGVRFPDYGGDGWRPAMSVARVPLFPPWVPVHVIAVGLPKPGSSCSTSSRPRTHFALFQKYRCGTSSRAGPPCSAMAAGRHSRRPPRPGRW
jgi:hypothetical protein